MKAIIAIILSALSSACAIPPVTPNAPTAPVERHVIWGDSLTWQAASYPSTPDMNANGYEWHVRPGKGMQELGLEIINTLNSNPKTVTLALGTNDAGTWGGRDGWNSSDEAVWNTVLSYRRDTKIVVVLPWIEDGNDTTQVDIGSVERAREWLVRLPNVMIVDWKDYVAPGVLDAGGIHVSAGNEGTRYHATVAGDPL